ncbi:MAG TPA: hypothetical protein VNJ54_21205 [Plantibacter sp.]|uniref:hypothetical protein n=1 Tax=Plantibacter sp. TaxID=1871045 RepID=UPI002CC1E5AE|nr:hypothetical protein [Plantibacter sp.]
MSTVAALDTIRAALMSAEAQRADSPRALADLVHDALVAASTLPAPPAPPCPWLGVNVKEPASTFLRCNLTAKHVGDHINTANAVTWTNVQSAGLLRSNS